MDLSTLTNGANSIPSLINSSKQKAVVTTVGFTGIGGFIMDIPTSEVVSLNSRVTNYTIVDGTQITDNYVNDTEEIELEGTFGMFSEVDTLGLLNQPTQFLGEKLKSIGSLGHLSSTQRSKLDKITQTVGGVTQKLSSITTSTQSILTLLSTSTADTRAGKVFDVLRILRDAKQMFSVDSAVYRVPSCVITSLSLTADKLSMTESIRVGFKRINTVIIKDYDKLSQQDQNLTKDQDGKTALQSAKETISEGLNSIKSIF